VASRPSTSSVSHGWNIVMEPWKTCDKADDAPPWNVADSASCGCAEGKEGKKGSCNSQGPRSVRTRPGGSGPWDAWKGSSVSQADHVGDDAPPGRYQDDSPGGWYVTPSNGAGAGGRLSAYHGGTPGSIGTPPLPLLDCEGLKVDAAAHAERAEILRDYANDTDADGEWADGDRARGDANTEDSYADEANCEWCGRCCPGAATDPSCIWCVGFSPRDCEPPKAPNLS
jgi:hypothetical protein